MIIFSKELGALAPYCSRRYTIPVVWSFVNLFNRLFIIIAANYYEHFHPPWPYISCRPIKTTAKEREMTRYAKVKDTIVEMKKNLQCPIW